MRNVRGDDSGRILSPELKQGLRNLAVKDTGPKHIELTTLFLRNSERGTQGDKLLH